ncbi:ABC transporter substrate-binding protein [Marinomonas balearica]|uniref:ABC transporter substrate-binding protein n=1 Tax=Marinomonas balearica TaxID=491947 RepID=UPI001FB656B2|nr:ABC transporter substrate-binding protein [Marinomonas balearica]
MLSVFGFLVSGILALFQPLHAAPVYFSNGINEEEPYAFHEPPTSGRSGIETALEVSPERTLHIQSTLDIESFEPLLKEFVKRNPDVKVAYEDINTLELYQNLLDEKANSNASLIISSAMDLQLKLVNDGYAERYSSFETDKLPSYAKWRNQIFAFSKEPVVMVINRAHYPGATFPDDRESLLASIRLNDTAFKGKIGTYDIRTSGVGYLLASQDARQADTMWGRLIEAFGSHDVKSYCCTGDMIDDVAEGSLIVAYNLLGSYAAQRVEKDPRLMMVLPKDYTLMLMRTALIPKGAKNYEDAGRFLDFILSKDGQEIMSLKKLLYPISSVKTDSQKVFAMPLGPTRVIELDQQLLVGRDLIKQQRFIEGWRSALEIKKESKNE